MRSLQQQISKLYYSHGFYVASNPALVICIVIGIILFCCYPLRYIPLPQNAPVDYITYPQSPSTSPSPVLSPEGSQPLAFIVQILMRAAVHPWSRDGSMFTLDALRAPLRHSFEIVRQVEATQTQNGSRMLADLCLQVGEPVFLPRAEKVKIEGEEIEDSGPNPLPVYSCLMTGPSSLWAGKEERFTADKHMLRTIYSQGRGHLKDIVFGLPWKETGVSRFMLRAVQRVVTFSVTLVLREYDADFIAEVRRRLREKYPYSEQVSPSGRDAESRPPTVVVYREKDYIAENKTLAMAYIVLLLYVYFSVRKIEMVKSKWGLAFSACFTVVASLLMSIGICVYFGLTPTLNGSEIFPYLVVLIGLENVLVITKSVVATPVELPVKYRVAQGLSKEGWAITKNLLGELSLLAIGFLTFNPAIQEFCLFALVGFTTDFFLQMFFFVTVLSIDIRRMELSEVAPPQGSSLLSVSQTLEDSSSASSHPSTPLPPATKTHPPQWNRRSPSVSLTAPIRISHHRRTASDVNTAAYFNGEKDERFAEYVPRRLRFLYYWAQTRVFHRVFKFVLICWILVIVYTTGIYKPFLDIITDFASGAGARDLKSLLASMQPLDSSIWTIMAYYHWPILFRYYNISLSGRHITVMPPIHLAHIVSPKEAISLRQRHDPDLSTSTPRVGGDAEGEGGWVGSSTLAGWADLGLTASLVFTCLLGVTAVLTTTYLSMCVFAWLTKKNRQGTREVRVVPLIMKCHPLHLSVERWAVAGQHAALAFPDSRVVVVRVDTGCLMCSLRPSEREEEDEGEEGSVTAVWSLSIAADGTIFVGLSTGHVEVWCEPLPGENASNSRSSYLAVEEGSGICTSVVKCGQDKDGDRGVLELSELVGGQPGDGPHRLYAGLMSGDVCEIILRADAVRGHRFGLATLNRRVRAHCYPISALMVGTNNHLVTGSVDFTIRIFHTGTLVASKTVFDHQAEITALHLAGSLLLSGSADGGLHVLDLNNGRRLLARCSSEKIHEAPVCTLTTSSATSNRFPRDPLSPDASRLLVSGDRSGLLCLWRSGRYHPLRTFQVNTLNLSPAAAVVLPKYLVFNDVGEDQVTLLVHNFQSNRAAVRICLQRQYFPCPIHSPVVPFACLGDRFLLCLADQCLLVIPSSAIR